VRDLLSICCTLFRWLRERCPDYSAAKASLLVRARQIGRIPFDPCQWPVTAGRWGSAQARQRTAQQPPERCGGDCADPRARLRQQPRLLAQHPAANRSVGGDEQCPRARAGRTGKANRRRGVIFVSGAGSGPLAQKWRAMSDEDRNYVHAVALRERGARIRLVETRGQSEVIGYAGETLVLGPQGCAGGQPGRRQEMSIDISDPTASEQM